MVDAIVSSLLGLLSSAFLEKAKGEARLLLGVEDEVRKLQTKLNLIRAVLDDAEEKETKSKPVKLWLDSFKEVCLDMEDTLDEWRTAMELDEDRARTAGARLRRKVCTFVSCFSLFRGCSRRDIALDIGKINKRLNDIVDAKNILGLEKRETNQNSTWRETSSIVDESKILGRDVEKNLALNELLGGESAEDEPTQTISLVGMGGLGKTALAKLVFNDPSIKDRFHGNAMWVCVSDVFDEKKVAKAILEGLKAGGPEIDTWEGLLQRISNSIRGKKFFLVLDDIWEDQKKGEKWEDLKACFKLGARGSRILVTTRKVSTATMMGSLTSQSIHLKNLGVEVCWSIIKQRALRGRHDSDNFEEIGRGIAAKCKGLPLAAKALGSLLMNKRSWRDWERVMKSEIWELEFEENYIFAPLLLSYRNLPPPVKQCFLFCAIYPKDHQFSVVTLISQWICHGYLGFDNDADLESIAEEYFNILANSSFFQDFYLDPRDGRIIGCKMHDVVHDFAKYLVGNEFVTKVVQLNDSGNIKLQNCRHLAMTSNESGVFPSFSISGAEKLRSLVIFSPPTSKPLSNRKSFPSLLQHSQRLRFLDLPYIQQVPNEIGRLIHLRWLNVEATDIKHLPEAVSNLRNMVYLNLSRCSCLKELPVWIGKLVNLRFLITITCARFTKYPKEVRELIRLRYLAGAIVRADCNDAQEFSIGDLENLRHLRAISFRAKGDTIDVDEARKAQLDQLPNFRRLWIDVDDTKESITEDVVIEAFNLPPEAVYFQRWVPL